MDLHSGDAGRGRVGGRYANVLLRRANEVDVMTTPATRGTIATVLHQCSRISAAPRVSSAADHIDEAAPMTIKTSPSQPHATARC
jgi:hypothetical protein